MRLLNFLLTWRATFGIQVAEVKSLEKLKLLEWNLHTECFRSCATSSDPHCDAHYPACRKNATLLLQSLLNSSVDFAGLVQLSERSNDLDPSFGQIHHICGGAKGFGVYPFDVATILFRSSRWSIKEVDGNVIPAAGGCLQKVNASSRENDYRAYVAQAFVNKETGLEVLVVVVHFPHQKGYEVAVQQLNLDLEKLKETTQVEKVLLLADTNQQKGNMEIIHDLGLGRKMAGNDVHITCCYPAYFFPYDRIMASNFDMSSVETILPFGTEANHHPPEWAVVNMHDPILVEFSLERNHSEVRSWAVRPAVAAILLVVFQMSAH